MGTKKVYWKGLRLSAHLLENYIERWDLQLSENLTSEQYDCVLDLLQAIKSCLALLPVNTPID